MGATPAHQQLTEAQALQQNEARKADRHARLTAWQQKKEQAAHEKNERKAAKRQKAMEEDRKRRQTKQQVKSKKKKETIYRSYTAEEIAAMSVSKRRNLQDRGII